MNDEKNYIYAVVESPKEYDYEIFEVTNVCNMCDASKCATLIESSYWIRTELFPRTFIFSSFDELTKYHSENMRYYDKFGEIRTFFKTKEEAKNFLYKLHKYDVNIKIRNVERMLDYKNHQEKIKMKDHLDDNKEEDTEDLIKSLETIMLKWTTHILEPMREWAKNADILRESYKAAINCSGCKEIVTPKCICGYCCSKCGKSTKLDIL